MTGQRIRPTVCADNRWYPASAVELQREVTSYIENAKVLDLPGEVVGLIVPHAGYYFSGHVAGAGYRHVRDGAYDLVVLIGPDHTGAALGGLAIPDYTAWHTPLGDILVDVSLVTELERSVSVQRIRHDREHSLEVQLPFLQVALHNFRLLPVMMGNQSPQLCRTLGTAIAQLVRGKRALLIASTDLSHYYPETTARELDRNTLQYILTFDPEGLCTALMREQAHACGGGPVAAVLFAARELGAQQAHLVKYATSGDVWPDREQVVGYAAVVLTRPRDKNT
ncbi:MAG: AmmeMemoRadiSam system protein B [Anaerolineae bacterium]